MKKGLIHTAALTTASSTAMAQRLVMLCSNHAGLTRGRLRVKF